MGNEKKALELVTRRTMLEHLLTKAGCGTDVADKIALSMLPYDTDVDELPELEDKDKFWEE